MKLLGSYSSQITSFAYQGLLSLLQTAIGQGELSGNADVTSATLQALIQQAQDFSDLPVAAAGQRVTDDVFNLPLQLLAARYTALENEVVSFNQNMQQLLKLVSKDTYLLDQLLAGAGLSVWAGSQPQLQGSDQYQWDFAMGQGTVSSDIAASDPTNGVIYPSTSPLVASYISTSDGLVKTGLVPDNVVRPTPVKNVVWDFSTTGQSEELYGPDLQWTKLSLLEPIPLVSYQNPALQVILPLNTQAVGVFAVSGQAVGGSLPIYIRTLFTDRRNSMQFVSSNAVAAVTTWTLHSWSVSGSEVHGATGAGVLQSAPLPAKTLDNIYVEASYNTIGDTDGTMQVQLVCLDSSGTALTNASDGTDLTVDLPGVTVDPEQALTFGTLSLPDVAGLAQIAVRVVISGQTKGTWAVRAPRVHLPVQLTSYQVSADSVALYTPDQVYFQFTDFSVDDSGQVTFGQGADGVLLTARFTELYPAYECSINQIDWSVPLMLDRTRPYPDNTTTFLPIPWGPNGEFPLTDEEGNGTGMYLTMLAPPLSEYYMQVTTPSDPNYGAQAMMTLELERPTYLNGLHLAPMVNYPARLIQVTGEGFTSDTNQVIYSNPAGLLLDREFSLRFPNVLVRKVFLSFVQESYNLKQYEIDTPSTLRQSILSSLESVLPYALQGSAVPGPNYQSGVLYEMGFENIAGELWSPTLPSVFVAGPVPFQGCPEIIRFDAYTAGTVDSYLCFKAYDSSGNVVDEQLQGVALPAGTCQPFPFAVDLDRTTVDHCDVYMKFVLRTADSLLSRFLIQVTSQ